MRASDKNLGAVALTMLTFGLGAGLPLVLLGAMSRELLLRWRGGMSATSKAIKQVLGLFLIAIGLLVVTDLDRSLEAGLVDISPQWLTNITISFLRVPGSRVYSDPAARENNKMTKILIVAAIALAIPSVAASAQSSADCITNMSGFDLRQAQILPPSVTFALAPAYSLG